MKTRKSTRQFEEHRFARALGRRPFLKDFRLKTKASLNLLSESFGPPERIQRKNLLFWNFVRDDGAVGFSLFSRVSKLSEGGELEVVLSAHSGAKTFGDWTIDRLAGLESGEETPFFVGAGRYAVVRLK